MAREFISLRNSGFAHLAIRKPTASMCPYLAANISAVHTYGHIDTVGFLIARGANPELHNDEVNSLAILPSRFLKFPILIFTHLNTFKKLLIRGINTKLFKFSPAP